MILPILLEVKTKPALNHHKLPTEAPHLKTDQEAQVYQNHGKKVYCPQFRVVGTKVLFF